MTLDQLTLNHAVPPFVSVWDFKNIAEESLDKPGRLEKRTLK